MRSTSAAQWGRWGRADQSLETSRARQEAVHETGLDDWNDVDSRAGIFGLQSTVERGTTSVVVVLRAVDVGRRGRLVEGMLDDAVSD